MLMDLSEEKVDIFLNKFKTYRSFLLGLAGKLEKVTHVDLNGDGMIGRMPDTFPGGVYSQVNSDPYSGGSSGYNQGPY